MARPLPARRAQAHLTPKMRDVKTMHRGECTEPTAPQAPLCSSSERAQSAACPRHGTRTGRLELLGPLLLSLLAAPSCALKTSTPSGAEAPNSVQYMKMEDDYTPAKVDPTDEPNPYFVLDGKPYCFAGTNNYYLIYKDDAAVLDVLDATAEMGLKVMRTWAFLDRGSLDGSVGNIREPGHKDGIYFQYWDRTTNRPAYNDGADGLEKLDFVLHHARKRGIKVLLAMTNTWRDFGGMDQYLLWYGLDQHHLFYTDERVKAAYKDWVQHLLTRVNSIDGTPYLEDPAIFAWELANEPRTMIFDDYDSPEGWDTSTITDWAAEMSDFVRSVDKNHMIAVGDEGFLADRKGGWTHEAPYGVDSEALTALPNVDFGTYHMYPDHWGVGHRWGMDWIEDHLALGRRVNKPMVLEEYGIHVKREKGTSGPISHGWERREVAYTNWNNVALLRGGSASMFWILSGIEKGSQLYPDYDHFTIYRGDDGWKLLETFAKRFPNEARACEMARGVDHGTPSPFVSAHGAPEAPPPPQALAMNAWVRTNL